MFMRTASLLTICAVAACGDDGMTPPVTEAKWQKLAERKPSSLLAAWSSGLDNVWIVGGREGAGNNAAVFHYDGAAWTKLDPQQPNVDIWQVFGFEGGPVFLGGSNGTILKYENGTFTKIPTPGTDIVFGLWGASPTDVWAVGGQPTGVGFVWRYNGTQFENVTGLPMELDGAVWKVTGRAADDVFMSASRGYVLHWDGQSLSNEQIGTTSESLFSIGCHETRCVTVGTNTTNGVLYEHEGQSWVSKNPMPNGPVWRGVTPTGPHRFVVGVFGAVIRDVDGEWVSDMHGLTGESLHAAWSDDEGNLFAVGGKFDRALTIDGVLLYKGKTELPPLP